MGENSRIAPGSSAHGVNERQQQGDGDDDQRRHRRFLRKPKPHSVTEEKLPRRAQEDVVVATLVSESDVDEAVEMDNRQGKHRMKLILGFVVVAVVISAVVDLSCHENIRSWLQASFDWIEENPRAGEHATSDSIMPTQQ